MPIHPNARRCTHIRLNGKQCGSPALTGVPYCHFHADVSQRRRTMKVPNLESTKDVQQAITETIRALLEGRIDRHRAKTVLFGLHLAQKAFGFNKMVSLKRDEEEGAPEDRSVVQKILDEVQPVEEFERQQELEEAEAAKEADADATRIARESLVDSEGRLRTYAERFPSPPQPHDWSDDIPRDENGYLKPTRKQEEEIEKWVMSNNHPKKTG